MTPTQELIREHDAVLLALQILEKVEPALAAQQGQPRLHLAQLLDFFKGFVDRCHHAKEEEVLFPELERRGVKREAGPIGVMLMEHDAGRAHIRAMSDSLQRLERGEDGALSALCDNARGYRDLLRAHIYKENNVLFPMAERCIPDEVAATIKDQFDAIERDRVDAAHHETYHAMLNTLKIQYGVE
jgi:hemerythrin-like domain-containing protein